MIRRLAASILSLSLLSSAAIAQDFAQPPAPRGAVADMADVEYMPARMHAPSRALLIRALAKRRAQNLARFHAYRTAGKFPHDFIAQTTLNVWRDPEGHLCAAATIIDKDDPALVRQVADEQNYVKLGEVQSGALLDWIMTSGFTQVEVSTIQEPFMGPREPIRRDNSWRIAEDARLKRKYARIEAMLRANTDDALAQAADRLAGNPELAWQLVGELTNS
ncbi:MAG TPA: hypothetical protein VL463_10390 [Kofleriaceae bacterium]|jgi:hypothetical protein|nr:hypothetical protein [Kofleriaceae bacterium]